nr:peptidase C48, SUMO/sentrin/Ubl1 [Tanacetum cinerariifolium]
MGDTVITPKTIKRVLGLPMGRRKQEKEGQREYNDQYLLQWKDQFENVNKLTIKALSDVTNETKNSDYIFRMNILTLIANTLESCENSSIVNFTILKNVFEGDDVSDIDRYSYIIACASISKLDWVKKLKKGRCVLWANDVLDEYLSSSSSESDDDNDDGSQLSNENEKSYRKKTHSDDEEKLRKTEETRPTTLLNVVKKDEQEMGTSKKDEVDNNKEEGMGNKNSTNQKITEEIDPFDDAEFDKYYIENEHLFVPTQTSAEKKKDQIDDYNYEIFFENEEENIRKGREFTKELRRKNQQQERERQRKGKKEKDQIGSSSQESLVSA